MWTRCHNWCYLRWNSVECGRTQVSHIELIVRLPPTTARSICMNIALFHFTTHCVIASDGSLLFSQIIWFSLVYWKCGFFGHEISLLWLFKSSGMLMKSWIEVNGSCSWIEVPHRIQLQCVHLSFPLLLAAIASEMHELNLTESTTLPVFSYIQKSICIIFKSPSSQLC